MSLDGTLMSFILYDEVIVFVFTFTGMETVHLTTRSNIRFKLKPFPNVGTEAVTFKYFQLTNDFIIREERKYHCRNYKHMFDSLQKRWIDDHLFDLMKEYVISTWRTPRDVLKYVSVYVEF